MDNSVIKKKFCRNVSSRLKQQNKSVRWLKLQIGDTSSRIYYTLRGETMPSLATSYRVAAALGVTIDDLLA